MKLPTLLNSSWFIFLVLLICSLLLYLPIFNSSWLMDDYSVIVNNPDIRSVGNFLTNSFPGRPLREISYLLDYALFGLDPWGYNFQNIFWHALNCWLVYLLAIRLKLSSDVAWLSSLLFLFHPIHVEVVANSSHRKDSLALAFLLMALLSYMKIFEHKSNSRRIFWLSSSLVFWITAFFAKGNSLIFPAIVIAYEYALLPEDNRLIVRWKQMVPILSVSSVVGLIAWYFYASTLPSFRMEIIGAFVKTENLASFSVSAYILMVLKSFAFMVSKLILPLNLSMEYIYAVPDSFLDPWVMATLLLIPLSVVISLRWKKSAPQLFILLLFGAVLWLPTANIFWHFAYFAADRYMYAPSAGLCILAVLASENAFSIPRKYFIVGWLCILSLFSLLTWKQTSVWQNEMSLYSHMLKVSPRSLEAMIGLSNAYYTAKDYDTSARYAQLAMERDFTDHRPYMILGNINYVHNRLNDALELLLESQKKNPLSPEVHNALGSVYDNLGKSAQAIEAFKVALKLRPDYFEAYTHLGVAYERTNNLSEAELMLNKAIAANSDYVPAWFNLGVVRYRKGDKQGARLAFSEALKRDPSYVDALTNLSVVCKEVGDDVCYSDAVRRLGSIVPNTAVKPPLQ